MKTILLALLVLLIAVPAFAQTTPVTLKLKEKVLLTANAFAAGNLPTTFAPGQLLVWSVDSGDQAATLQAGPVVEAVWVVPARTGTFLVTVSTMTGFAPMTATCTVTVTDEPVTRIAITAGTPIPK